MGPRGFSRLPGASHRPGMRGARRQRCVVSAAVAGMVIAASVMVVTAATSSAAAASPLPNRSDFACELPQLPRGVPKSSSRSDRLSGPAVTALTGKAARHGFSLDGGALIVTPPRRGDIPELTEHQAICGAMAGGLGALAPGGVAAGYGRVSIASRFFPATSGILPPGDPKVRTVESFTDRLAWLVVVHRTPLAFYCPAETQPIRLTPRPTDHDYEVFIIDARSGSDALVYVEGAPGGCVSGARVPPALSVAEESVSVPWTLTSRDPNGYSGTISATVLPCDQYPDTVLVDRDRPDVEVQVIRPYGPPCGRSEQVSVSLHAAVVTADLPAVIGHDPVGLVTDLPTAPRRTTPTTTTTPVLVPVDATMNGQTVQVAVGQVITVQPLPGALGVGSVTSPAMSTNPAVLGPLTSGPQPLVAEFRAWKAGKAEITVAQSACVHPGSSQVPCDGAFVVYVVVR